MSQKVSLVLSGGGARGIAHIGVIEELERQGYVITSISGTSMGALVGGVYALGRMEAYKDWLFTLDKLKVISLVDFTLSSQGFVKGDKVLNKMKEFISDANIEDLNIHFTAVAADLLNKKEVVFTKGSIYQAIRASIAIPTVITPVKTEDGLLVDGGVINNLPISHARRQSDEILIAVNVNADVPKPVLPGTKKEKAAKQTLYQKKMAEFYKHLQRKVPLGHKQKLGYFDLINMTISLMSYHIDQLALERYSPDVLINISHELCNVFDFYKAEEMVEYGRLAAKECLLNYKIRQQPETELKEAG